MHLAVNSPQPVTIIITAKQIPDCELQKGGRLNLPILYVSAILRVAGIIKYNFITRKIP